MSAGAGPPTKRLKQSNIMCAFSRGRTKQPVFLTHNFACKLLCKGLQLQEALKRGLQEQEYGEYQYRLN